MRNAIGGLFLGYISLTVASAMEVEHLAYPPEDVVVYELVSTKSAAPIQLIGSLSPPSLLFNGRLVKLVEDRKTEKGSDHNETSGAFVNGTMIPTEGDVGRFFYSVPSEISRAESLVIVLSPSTGPRLKAVVPINRIFMENEFRVTSEKWNAATKKVDFLLSGYVPPGNRIESNAGKVRKLRDSRYEFSLSLPIGKTTFTVKVINKLGGQKLVNVPVKVTELKFDSNRPVFSVVVPTEKFEGSEWIVPYYGFWLEAHVKNIKIIRLNGEEFTPSEDTFSKFYVPKEKRESLEIKVEDTKKRFYRFEKQLSCPDCDEKPSWNSARFRIRGDWYFETGALSYHWMTPRNGRVSADFVRSAVGISDLPLGLSASIRVGRFFTHRFAISAAYRHRFSKLEDQRIGRTINLNQDQRVELQGEFFMNSAVFGVLGLGFWKTSVEYENFSSDISNSNSAFVGFLGLGIRFPLSNKLEIVSRFSIYPTQFTLPINTPEVRWYDFNIEPLGLRANF